MRAHIVFQIMFAFVIARNSLEIKKDFFVEDNFNVVSNSENQFDLDFDR